MKIDQNTFAVIMHGVYLYMRPFPFIREIVKTIIGRSQAEVVVYLAQAWR